MPVQPAVEPPGSGGYLHTHTPVDASAGFNPGAPTYPNPPGSSAPEWPTPAAPGAFTVTAVSSGTPGATSATITWTTSRASDSVVQYGPGAGGYTNTARNATLVTSHSVVVGGLTTATLYHFRVTSYDGVYTVSSADGTFTTA